MHLSVRGGTTEQKRYVRDVLRFAADKLMTKRLSKTLDVKVKLKPELFVKEWVYGDTEVVDFDNRRPKEFKLRVDSDMTLRNLLMTLVHEMVHVKQYARDELREVNKDGTTVHRHNGKYISNDVDYWDQPWEIEAHGRERGIFEQWVEQNSLLDESMIWHVEDLYPKGYWDSKK